MACRLRRHDEVSPTTWLCIPDFLSCNEDDSLTPRCTRRPAGCSCLTSKSSPHHVPKALIEISTRVKMSFDPPKLWPPGCRSFAGLLAHLVPSPRMIRSAFADWARDNSCPADCSSVARCCWQILASLYANGFVTCSRTRRAWRREGHSRRTSRLSPKGRRRRWCHEAAGAMQLPRDHTNQAAQDARLLAREA